MFGFFSSSVPSITVEELRQKLTDPNAVLIDVRSPDEFSHGHVDGAVNLPLEVVGQHADELKKYATVYLICRSGGRSSTAAEQLKNMGVDGVTNVTGGITAWQSAGFAVV